jgi:hypothetical protein
LQIGDKKASVHYLNEAVTAARVIPNNIARADTLWRISTVQAEAGDIAGALETAQSRETEFHHVSALRDIATVQAKTGDRKGSLKTLSILKKDDKQEEYRNAVCNTAYLLALSGNVQGAVQLASEGLDREPEPCMRLIVTGQIESGDISGAQASIATFDSSEKRAVRTEELIRLKKLVAEDGSHNEIMAKISDLIFENSQFDRIRISIVEAIARSGNTKTSLAALASLDGSLRDESTIERIAGAMARGGKAAEVLSWARTRKDSRERSHALLGVAGGISSRKAPLQKTSICER